MPRESLREDLDNRQRNRCIEEVFSEIVPNAIELARCPFQERPEFIFSCDSFKFLRSNQLFEHPVYYSPIIIMQFEKLALAVMIDLTDSVLTDTSIAIEENSSDAAAESASKELSWDSSLSTLLAWISKVSDEQERERLKRIAATLMESAALPPHPSSLLQTAMYKALSSVVNQMVEVAEEMKMQRVIAEESLEKVYATEEDTQEGDMGGPESGQSMQRDVSVEDKQANLEKPDMGSTQESGQGMQRGVSLEAKQVNLDKPDMGTAKAEVAGEGNQSKGDENMDGKSSGLREGLRIVLQEGMELFWVGLEEAAGKLVSLINCKIECCMAGADLESAAWIALWLERIMDHISAP